MAKTVAVIKAELIAAGWQGEITPEILRQKGWDPVDPLEGLVLNDAAQSDQEVKDQLSLLEEEGIANNVPTAIFTKVKKIVGMALALKP